MYDTHVLKGHMYDTYVTSYLVSLIDFDVIIVDCVECNVLMRRYRVIIHINILHSCTNTKIVQEYTLIVDSEK
jgi:hypothetical protein